ncbi:MAG: APC family permease [Candidatus Heimdallarchaeaceae archaeon]
MGLWELIFVGVGIILGAGIYVIIGPAAGMAGNALWLSFLIAAVVALFTGLSYAELSSRFPKAGAEYVYIKYAFGERIAFIVSWMMIISGIIATATVALGFAGYLNSFIQIEVIPTSILLIFFMSMILIYGIKESAWFAIICSLIEMFGLLLIIIISIPSWGSVDYFSMPDFSGLISAAALVFFAFIGFENIVNTAEEVKNPVRNVPRAVILSILITTVIYILVAVSSVSVLGWERLSVSKAPLAEVASASLLGSRSFILLSSIALFATANTVLLVLLGISRLIYGMADSNILPKILGKVHKTRKTPWIAIIFLMVLSMLFVLIGNIKTVANLTNASILLVFLAINSTLIMIRYQGRNKLGTDKTNRVKAKIKVKVGAKIKKYKMEAGVKHELFTVPLSIKWLPVIPVFGAVTCLLLLISIELYIVLISILLIIPGLIVYEIIHRKGLIEEN